MEKKYIVSSKEMKRYDSVTINHYGVPSLVLMERAALGVIEEIEKRFEPGSRALVVAGGGNNGGDGIAIGRVLKLRGYAVDFVLTGDKSKCSAETSKQLDIIEKYGCPVQSKIENKEYDIIIDALFGIGLSRDVKGIYAQCIEAMNDLCGFVFAVDIPSGISADTGEVMKTAVKADITVTFAYEKLGHVLYPGCEYCGEVVCKDIGITAESFLAEAPRIYSYADVYKSRIAELMPERNRGGNKGTFGKVLVIAGSKNMSGACELCARSAYRIGAGMVKVVTSEENRENIQKNLPEALLVTYAASEQETAGEAFAKDLEESVKWADCIVIGPGLGKSRISCRMLKYVIQESLKPLVIDADGLNILAESAEFQEKLRSTGSKEGRQIIITPHIVEFARLYGCTPTDVKRDVFNKAKELAERLCCTVICKDARTAVASYKENNIYLNTTGNDGMATAGSGDVLAGIEGGLLAQGMDGREAAIAGVYIHGILGERAASETGRYAVIAGDLTEQLKYILSDEGKRR